MMLEGHVGQLYDDDSNISERIPLRHFKRTLSTYWNKIQQKLSSYGIRKRDITAILPGGNYARVAFDDHEGRYTEYERNMNLIPSFYSEFGKLLCLGFAIVHPSEALSLLPVYIVSHLLGDGFYRTYSSENLMYYLKTYGNRMKEWVSKKLRRRKEYSR